MKKFFFSPRDYVVIIDKCFVFKKESSKTTLFKNKLILNLLFLQGNYTYYDKTESKQVTSQKTSQEKSKISSAFCASAN